MALNRFRANAFDSRRDYNSSNSAVEKACGFFARHEVAGALDDAPVDELGNDARSAGGVRRRPRDASSAAKGRIAGTAICGRCASRRSTAAKRGSPGALRLR